MKTFHFKISKQFYRNTLIMTIITKPVVPLNNGRTVANARSIKDLITKFEKLDNLPGKTSRQIANRPVSTNFETNSVRTNIGVRPQSTFISNLVLKKLEKNDDTVFFSSNFNEINKSTNGCDDYDESPNDNAWNSSRRRSSVKLVKPSSLSRKKSDRQNSDESNESLTPLSSPRSPLTPSIHLHNQIILPRRVSGPIYESRRQSFSTVKPSEIWESDELPVVLRRNSKMLDEKLSIRKKSIPIVEVNEDAEPTRVTWVKRPGDLITKPSNVRTAEASIKKTPNLTSPKDTLLRWCQKYTRNYKNINITNFSSSWSNGLAFCALIHSFFPNAFDYNSLKPENRRENFQIAFDTAEKYADITPLLEVDDMIMMGDKPDYKCVFTYVGHMCSKLNKLESEF